jgi:hypothetical protein
MTKYGALKIYKTEIMTSFNQVGFIFKSYPNDRNFLLICSDMVENSFSYNFNTEILNANRIQEIIDNEKRQGDLPDLSNVSVYVITPGTKQDEKYFQVKDFWLKYFDAAGAKAYFGHYDRNLVDFIK